MNNSELRGFNLINKVVEKENNNEENIKDENNVEEEKDDIQKEIRMILSKKITLIKEILEKIK